VPRGFSKDNPAAEYLKYYRFVAGREFPASLATGTEFYSTLIRTFQALMPLVRFLNEPLLTPSFKLPASSFERERITGSW
jgi:hypothetical protein